MFNRDVPGDGVTGRAGIELSWGELVKAIRVWIRQNFVRTVVMAVIGFVVGWAINTYIIAVRYEGNNAVAGIGTSGGFFEMLRNGGMYWGILSTIVFSLLAYGRRAGWRRMGQEIASIPRVLRDTFVTGGTTAWAVLLAGGAISLAVAVLIGPAVAGILSVGLLLAAPSPISAIFGKVVSRLLIGLIRLFSPAKESDIPHLGGTVAGVAGTAAGMLVAWQMVSTPTKLALAVAAGVAAFLLVTKAVTPPTAAGMLFILVVVSVFRDVFDATAVLADDGGWQECGDCSVIDWAQSSGATEVIIDGARGGVASGAGAALGTGLGSAVAGGTPPPGPGVQSPGSPPDSGADADGPALEEDVFPPEPADAELFPPEPGEGGASESLVSPAEEFPPPPGEELFTPEEGEQPDDGELDEEEGPLAEGKAAPEEGEVTDEDDLGDRPPRYRERTVETATTVAPGLEDDRVIDPDRVETGPDGRPLTDPDTGRPLPVDMDGNVRYGDGWMSPEQAAERIATDQRWLDARGAGQDLVDDFKRTREQLANESDPTRQAELDQRLNELTNKINESYSGKNVLKGEGRTEVGTDFDTRLSETYSKVDQDFINRLNEMGFQRGGRPWTLDDITEFRNAASKGTVGMDRDIGLDEGKLRDLMTELNKLPPNTPEAIRVAEQLAAGINRTKITVDYDKYTSQLSNEIARANAELERLSGELANATPGSPEAERIQGELNRLGNRPAELQSELARVQAQADGRGVVDISPSRWNDTAVSTYGRSFSDITGGDAEGAYQAVTQRHNQEAYGDKGVLSGDADKFSQASAEQTASVSRVKLAENEHLADQGQITQGEAIQETARGYAKDIATKVIPHMTDNANVDPAKADMIRRIGEVLEKVGRGEISPGQVDQALAKAVPEVDGMTLDKATRIVGFIRADVSRVGQVFGKVTDAATVDHYTRQHIAAGKDPAEALALATAQTAAGNAAMASGIADPRMSMAGGALLPGGMNNMLPDMAVENWVGTTYDAGSAAVQSVSDSLASGQLDTRALDDFAEGVTQREGTDPFKGIGQASQLLGEEMARTDGGNLVTDMQRIIETGAGADVLNESMSDFQQEVAAGQHGVALQGLDEVARIASETVADPMGTVGQFVDDIKNVATYGVGDGYWEESWDHTRDVIEKTPLVGTVVDGYNQIASGLGEQGVVGFAEEMYEGGTALAGEAYDAAGNAVGDVYDYLKDMW